MESFLGSLTGPHLQAYHDWHERVIGGELKVARRFQRKVKIQDIGPFGDKIEKEVEADERSPTVELEQNSIFRATRFISAMYAKRLHA